MTVRKHSPIAVVGVSTLFPGSVDTTGFWRNIVEGNDLMSAVPPGHWLTEDYYDPDPKAPDKTYANRGAFLPEVDFDPMAWGIPPNIVPATDTCQLLALIVAQRVLDDAAKGQFKYEDRERMSVMLGVTSAQELLGAMVSRLQRPVWTQSLRDMGMPESQVQEACTRIESHYTPWQESTFPGILGNVVAGRIANRLDLGGKNCVTDAACASSLAALSMSITELQMGDSDVCICGGADTMNDIFMYMCFSKTPALSQTGDCRPFSDDADGTMLGEGFGMLALKRLEDAERDGDRVYGVIRGLGGSSDGRAKSVYAPVPAGQAKAVRRAYAQAEFGAETVELVEAHGTGTIAGDAAEFEGMKTVFREADANTKQWCAVGSVKSQIGHTKAAAGAAGMVKAVLALHHKVFPPSIKIHAPNPKLDLEQSPFYLSARTRPWIRNSDHPRRAAVSAFGFGGSNFHVALEEYTGPADKAYRRRTAPTELVLLSADSHDALASRCRELSAQVSEPGTLVYLARTTQESYDPKANARLALVAKDEAELAQKLDKAAGLVMKGEAFETPDGLAFGLGAIEGDVAFLFPGQGSQFIDMGADLAMNWDDARAPWDAAADLDIFRAEPLHDVVFPKPAFEEEALAAQGAKLTATEWAQPGIGVTSLASLRLMRAIGLEPSAVAGHSFGEVIALHAAGVLSEEDAMRVARRRGELMAEAASTPGSMTAVSASAEVVRGLLAKSATGVVLANDNSPAQVVVSGKTDAIAAFEKELDAEGVRFTRLGVATAFHSEVVSASTIPFGEFLASVNVSSPELPVYANSEAAPYPSDAGAIRALLGNQIARPVRFVEEIEAMYAAGVRTFVEVGPGSVLTGLVGRILKGRPHRAISTDRKGRHGVTSLNHALGKLAAAGAEMNVGALWQAFEPASDPRDVSKPRMVMKLSGSNYGKPYPPENGAAGRTKPNPERLEAPAVERIQERALTDTVHTPAARIAEPALVQPIAVQPVAVQAVAVQPVAQPVAQPIAVQAVAVQAAMPASAPVSDAWATAYQEAQRQTAEAHSTYTRSMAEAHGAFLELQKASFLGLAQMMNTSVTVQAAPMQPAPMQPAPMQVAPMQPAHAPTWSAPVAAPAPVVAAAPGPMPAPVAAPVAAPVVVAPVAAPAPVAAAPAPVAAPTMDLHQLMLEVVADKTGYPVDMLQLSMDLEADLGVDSIKRVEILSAMREREPNLPDVDPTELSKLRTLQEIVDAMDTREQPASALVAAATTPEPAASHATTPAAARYALRLVNAPASGFALPRLASAKRLVITDDGAGVAGALVDALARRGVSAQAVSEIPNDADGVIFLGGLADLPDVNAALAVNRQAFLAAKTIADKAQGEGAVFVTVQDTGGDFGLTGSARAWLGGLPGLVKTAAQEWPHAGLRAIDLERGGRDGATLAEVLAEELLRGGPTRVVGASGGGLEVALAADGSRRTLQSYAAEVQRSTPVVTKDSVLLCSGGARGVTAATLIALAGDTGCSLILLGRTPLEDEDEALRGAQTDAALKKALLALAQAAGEKLTPAELGKRASRVLAGREVRATLNAIDMVGGRATYVAASVTDASALRAALAPIRAEFGKITGIVHGAGVLADRMIADKTVDQFDWVFSTKVDGLRTLLEVTAEDDISLLLTFSSVAARCGNRGQCDYAMANEVLNKVVTAESARRGGALFARSMGWGPWAGGMVTPALKARFEAMGVPLIALPVGARMLVDELSDGSGNVELVLGGEPKPEALLEDGTSAGERFEVHVSQATYPVIDHHRVQGTPVVPVALVLEWFARGVGAARPDLVLHTIEHLKVLSGIKLEHFEGGGEDFTVVVRRLSNGDGATFGLELLDSAGRRRYSARARAERVAHAASTRPTAPANLAALKGPVYDGVALFHGPQFQVIRGLPDVGDAGLMANLVGASEVGWPQASWQTDPALVDGGLQLALLWTAHTLGGASLPTALGKLEVFQRGLPVGELRATLTGHEARGEKTVCDVSFVDAAGTKVAKLGGVEMHVIPGSRSTSGTPTN